MPYELLYGRVGFLYACLFINKHVAEETIPWSVTVSTELLLSIGWILGVVVDVPCLPRKCSIRE